MSEPFDSWAIVELMGHVRMAGRLTEEERFGAKLGRVDVPIGDTFTTVYFGGGSVYRVTPTTEEVARLVASRSQPEPVHQWELPSPKEAAKAFVPTANAHRDSRVDDENEAVFVVTAIYALAFLLMVLIGVVAPVVATVEFAGIKLEELGRRIRGRKASRS